MSVLVPCKYGCGRALRCGRTGRHDRVCARCQREYRRQRSAVYNAARRHGVARHARPTAVPMPKKAGRPRAPMDVSPEEIEQRYQAALADIRARRVA